jgi:2-polyprenyl-3-methyl-5-hydroxy-6-metoxy-1,4-benzoquinol methylase
MKKLIKTMLKNKKLSKMVLKSLLTLRKKLDVAVSLCGIASFDGLHPKNVYDYRSEFFVQNVNENDVIIDIACGTGLILSKIAPLIKKGYGIELSRVNLDICNTKHFAENIEYLEGDLYEVNYGKLRKATGYTTAIYSHILEHLKDVPTLLSRVNADKVLICVPNQENWRTQLLVHLGLPYLADRSHYREYSREMLRRELALASYQVDFIGFNAEGEIVCKAIKKNCGSTN